MRKTFKVVALSLFALSSVAAYSVQPLAIRHRAQASLIKRFGSSGQDLGSSLDHSIIEYDDFLPQPHPDLSGLDVVHACMKTLIERRNGGLEVCFNFASDNCRAALGGSLDEFNKYATNPVFGFLINSSEYEIINEGSIIAGTPTRGAMQTILMDAKQTGDKSDSKRFLWTMQQERRPPRQGCWIIHEVLYTKYVFSQTE